MSGLTPGCGILLARWPRRGRVKTRLAAGLGEDAALRLHRAMVQDALVRLDRLARLGLTVRVLWDDGGDPSIELRNHLAAHPDQGLQEGSDLGARIAHALEEGLARGHAACLVLGTDSPTLPDGRILEGIEAVRGADLAFGPCEDGGFYLVAARRPLPGVFTGIAWGTGQVLDACLNAATSLGASTRLLPTHTDVDRPADLERLRAELADPGGEAAFLAPATRRTLASLT
jgi:rSAM/selenodomain-associated transferase 1